jgi:hypothetical protein
MKGILRSESFVTFENFMQVEKNKYLSLSFPVVILKQENIEI